MGIVLNKTVNEGVIEEFQNCGLYPHDTSQIQQLFLKFRTQRMKAMDGKHFGLRINAKQLSEWRNCKIQDANKLIFRWKSTIAVKRSSSRQLLNELSKANTINVIPTQIQKRLPRAGQKLGRPLSALSSPVSLGDIKEAKLTGFSFNDDPEISMLPLFCAMVLLSSGKVSEKLKLIIDLFVNNQHDSVQRAKLDEIIENTISAIVVLLDMKKYHDKLRRNTKRHIYQQHCNNSMTFKEISRGSLAAWLATSPYVLHIFCLRNTTDAIERYTFLHKFYNKKETDDDQYHHTQSRSKLEITDEHIHSQTICIGMQVCRIWPRLIHH